MMCIWTALAVPRRASYRRGVGRDVRAPPFWRARPSLVVRSAVTRTLSHRRRVPSWRRQSRSIDGCVCGSRSRPFAHFLCFFFSLSPIFSVRKRIIETVGLMIWRSLLLCCCPLFAACGLLPLLKSCGGECCVPAGETAEGFTISSATEEV
jgi:hypothetical protein